MSKSMEKRIAIQQQAEIDRLRGELKEAVEIMELDVMDKCQCGDCRRMRAFIERNKEEKP